MFPWGHSQAVPAYAVGDAIYSGTCRGAVVSVDGDRMQVLWSDADYGPITYPVDAGYIEKVLPWE